MIQLLFAYALKAAFVLALASLAAFALRWAPARLVHMLWTGAMAALLALLPAALLLPQVHLGLVEGGTAGEAANILLLLWLVPAALLLARIGAQHARLALLRARMEEVEHPVLMGAAKTAAEVLGLRQPARIGWAPGAMPLAFGLWRPAILLPRGAEAWPEARLRMTLLHETAHVARRDAAWQALASVVTALHWFNPLARLGAQRMRSAAEGACDALALGAGAPPAAYARTLLETAREAAGRGAPAGAVPMVSFRELEKRMKAVLAPARPARRTSGLVLVGMAAAAIAVLCTAPLRVEGPGTTAAAYLY